MKLKFTYDWQEPDPAIRLVAHRQTLANLTIAVDEKVFTSNRPIEYGDEPSEIQPFVVVSVFPLAEFIAANWWPLLYEPMEKPVKDKFEFAGRHWINRHTDGFAYPEIGFFGAGSSVRLSAKPSSITFADVDFPVDTGPSGKWEGLERAEVEEIFLAFLKETCQRLPNSEDRTWLSDAVERISTSISDPDENAYCSYAGLLGADPYASGNDLEEAITKTISILGEDISAEMFATSELSAVTSRANFIASEAAKVIGKSKEVATYALDLKKELRDHVGSNWIKPWDQGYDAARELRSELGIQSDEPLPSLDAVSKVLLGKPSMATTMDTLEKRSGVRGLGVLDKDGLGIAIAKSGRNPQFELASAFSDFLFSDEDNVFLTTRTSTDRQKRNRAFAAEFVAPIDAIMHSLRNRYPNVAEIDRVAKELGVSNYIVRYQIENQATELF